MTPPSDVAGALRTLELNEARWQSVLRTARDAIISMDTSGRITLFNYAAESIFQYPAAEVAGRNVNMLMPSPYQEEHDGYLRSYRETRVPKAIGQVREVEARRKDGEVFPIELSVSEARVGDEVIYTAIIRDVSERRRAEAQMRVLERLARERERLADVGAITAKIVHDLGNPLAALSMQAQLLLRRSRRAEQVAAVDVREPAERMLATTARLDALVKEFMAFTRERRLDVKQIALPLLLQETVDLWRPVAEAREIDLLLAAEDVEHIHADENQLKRVLDNLVKNAIEAIEQGPGTIKILTEAQSERHVRISVEDDGPGFPPSVEGFRLFETTKPQGTGLGLAVAHQIVLAHGGKIEFHAVSPHGTVFRIDLPRVSSL